MTVFQIDTTKLRQRALALLKKLDKFYIKLNQDLVWFWRKYLPQDKEGLLGWFYRFVYGLLDNPATILLVNTVTLVFLGNLLGAFFSEQVNLWIKLFVALNIFVFLARILGWKDKV